MEQLLQKQTEAMTRTVKQITEAVRELRVVIKNLMELYRPDGLPEVEPERLAQEGMREMRGGFRRERERLGIREERKPTPTPEEIRQWRGRREESRQREAIGPSWRSPLGQASPASPP
jgi:hypothetical protein